MKPKMFAGGNDTRCPVALFKKYIERRPTKMKTTGPFYLSVIDNPTLNVWYKKTPMGKNTINNIVKTMKENSPLNDMIPDKKLTNHSARKTVVKKLKSCGVLNCEIKNITGHKSEQGLDAYDLGDKREQRVLSNIIDGTVSTSETRRQILPARQQYSMPLSPRNVYNFQNCQVTFNTAGNNCTQASSALAQTKRPLKRCILYSDSDSDQL